MPRSVSADFATAVAASRVKPAILIEGLFDSGTLRLWTGFGTITWNGHEFTGGGNLLKIEPIEETGRIEALGTRLTISGIPAETVSLAVQEPYQGRLVKIYQALLDASGFVIADPDERFTGRADVMALAEDGQSATISLSIESRLIDLQRPRERRYTHDDQRIYYPADKGFEFVAKIQDREIQWGPR